MDAHNLKSVGGIGSLLGKTVLTRLDFNVPCSGGVIRDDYRIKKSLPTIELLRSKQAKTVLTSHFEGEGLSLRPVFEYLRNSFPLTFASSLDELPHVLAELLPGGVVLLENIRQQEGEKNNDIDLAKRLASFADLYVNEAFSASHRAHASIVGVPRFIPGYAGLLFDEEIKNLVIALAPSAPSFFVLGGAKFETKLPLVKRFLDVYDKVFIGGGLIADILEARAGKVGRSGVSLFDVMHHPKLILPTDVIVTSARGNAQKALNEIAPDERIVDVGPGGVELLRGLAEKANTVLWNGPLGEYEKGFADASDAFAEILAETSAHTILGGGDTVAAALKVAPIDSFSFVSTGGGAMLEFLTDGTLVGIEALEESQKKFLV